MIPLCYLDSSAIVKLVLHEAETTALRSYLRGRACIASALVTTEVIRAVQGHRDESVSAARSVLARVRLVRVTDEVLDDASMLRPASLRSLDAIHLATARLFHDELSELVTYDKRMADAARILGIPVVSPS